MSEPVAASDVLLTAEHVAKSYGRRSVLTDVSLQLTRGTITGVTGENGSGKSTLLNILVGRLRADAGRIAVTGRVGYCPQDLLIFDGLTVDENFRYFATAYGLDRANWQEAARTLEERFRFEPYARMPANQLSGGTRQKLNLALALLPDPDLLVLNEPYAGFDWETYVRFWDYARELRDRGRSVLVVSHFVYDRTQFDTVLSLEGGVLK